MGITEDEYDASVTGKPKKLAGFPLATSAVKLGCNSTPPKVMAMDGLHLNVIADEYANNMGKK
jgi:hypothetical protein